MADLLLEYHHADGLLAAARRLRDEGRRFEAFTPFPVDGLAELVGFADRRVPKATLAGGVIGAVAGFGMQAATNLAYPIDIGGRPLVTWQGFALVTALIALLFAIFAALGTMLVLNHLPRLNHPVFDDPRFGLAEPDRFFLLVPDTDRDAVADLDPRHVAEVPA